MIKMSGRQLGLLRRLFMLTEEEAAKHIGFVEVSEWKKWEKGVALIPQYVVNRVAKINNARQAAISEFLNDNDVKNANYSYAELTIIMDFFYDEKNRHQLSRKVPELKFDSVVAGVHAHMLDKIFNEGPN